MRETSLVTTVTFSKDDPTHEKILELLDKFLAIDIVLTREISKKVDFDIAGEKFVLSGKTAKLTIKVVPERYRNTVYTTIQIFPQYRKNILLNLELLLNEEYVSLLEEFAQLLEKHEEKLEKLDEALGG